MQELPYEITGLFCGLTGLFLYIFAAAVISAIISTGVLRRLGRETPGPYSLFLAILAAAIAAILLTCMLGDILRRLWCPPLLACLFLVLTLWLSIPALTVVILSRRDELGDRVTIITVLLPCLVVFGIPLYTALLLPLVSRARSAAWQADEQYQAPADSSLPESPAEEGSEPDVSEHSDTEPSDEPAETVEPDPQSSLEEAELESTSEDDRLRFAELVEEKLLTSTPEEVAGLLQQNEELGVKFVQHRADLAAEFFQDHPELAVETFQKNAKLAAEFFHGNPEAAAELFQENPRLAVELFQANPNLAAEFFQDHPDLADQFSEEKGEPAGEAEGKMTEEETQDKPQDEEETVAETAQEPTYRTWKDESGDFSVEAAFGGLAMGTVILHKKDGSKLKVPMERLSQDDQQWIRDRAKQR